MTRYRLARLASNRAKTLPGAAALGSALALTLTLAVVTPALAQGGPDIPTVELPGEVKKPVEPAKPPAAGPMAPGETKPAVDVPVLSRRGLHVLLGGAAEIEYKEAEKNGKPGTYRALAGTHRGFDIDKVTFTLDVSYEEDIWGKAEFEFNENGALLDEGYVIVNRPLTGYKLPVASDHFSDSLLVGLEDPFWRNDNRIGESYSLLGESLYRDERLQLLYTLSAFDFMYACGGISNGSVLALAGRVDETENFPILQDDRGSLFASYGDENVISRTMEVQVGVGFVYDLARGRPSPLSGRKPFRPMDLYGKHADIVHLGVWYTADKLSRDEQALLAGLFTPETTDRDKWRLGSELETVYDLTPELTARLRGEYAHTEDGDLRRNFWTAEAALTIAVPHMRYVRTVTPFARLSAMTTSRPGPEFGAGASDDVLRRALISGERQQLTFGLSIGVAPNVRLIFEYSANYESFNAPAGVAGDVDNDLFLAAFHLSW